MKVEVRFLANLRERFGKFQTVELENGATVGDLFEKLNLEKEMFLAMVNGRREFNEKTLSSDDRIALFPPVGGG